MRRITVVCMLLVLAGVLAAGPGSGLFTQSSSLSVRNANAADWRAEFDEICAKTNEAMTMSVEELKRLVERCDALMATIETLEETEKKVYKKRLRLCRDLYAYVVESKEKK